MMLDAIGSMTPRSLAKSMLGNTQRANAVKPTPIVQDKTKDPYQDKDAESSLDALRAQKSTLQNQLQLMKDTDSPDTDAIQAVESKLQQVNESLMQHPTASALDRVRGAMDTYTANMKPEERAALESKVVAKAAEADSAIAQMQQNLGKANETISQMQQNLSKADAAKKSVFGETITRQTDVQRMRETMKQDPAYRTLQKEAAKMQAKYGVDAAGNLTESKKVAVKNQNTSGNNKSKSPVEVTTTKTTPAPSAKKISELQLQKKQLQARIKSADEAGDPAVKELNRQLQNVQNQLKAKNLDSDRKQTSTYFSLL